MNWKQSSMKTRLSGLPRTDRGCFMSSTSKMQKKRIFNNHFKTFNIKNSKTIESDNDSAFICRIEVLAFMILI